MPESVLRAALYAAEDALWARLLADTRPHPTAWWPVTLPDGQAARAYGPVTLPGGDPTNLRDIRYLVVAESALSVRLLEVPDA